MVIITGANQGGKTTFLRRIGLARIMMQCGMFVPAKAFTANVCERTLTHFKREEDTAMESGKFDEELRRMDAHHKPHLCRTTSPLLFVRVLRRHERT